MTRLGRLYEEFGQSPWLDDLTRSDIHDGTLAERVAGGVRGVTANPTIFTRAIEASDAYDDQLHRCVAAGRSVRDAYWDLVTTDVTDACRVLRRVFDDSDGSDGFVSAEVAPELAHDTNRTIAAARQLHERIALPNLLVKIPATAAGIPAIRAMTAEGRNINVTLIFSVGRYADVIDAYLDGLEELAQRGGNLATVVSVASFFVSRVDTEVDRRLDALGARVDSGLRSRAAIAQAKLAYEHFAQQFSGARWDRLASGGARVQRPLWASTSTKDPALPDTRYVDGLIGPHTVTTLPERTLDAFEDHGRLSRTIDADIEDSRELIRHLRGLGIAMDGVADSLEANGIAAFERSYRDVLGVLRTRARTATP